jgi:hypothetical protein
MKDTGLEPTTVLLRASLFGQPPANPSPTPTGMGTTLKMTGTRTAFKFLHPIHPAMEGGTTSTAFLEFPKTQCVKGSAVLVNILLYLKTLQLHALGNDPSFSSNGHLLCLHFKDNVTGLVIPYNKAL